jgi:predicted dehydrogenase
MNRLRVALVGLGAISHYWLNAINKSEKMTLVGVCDLRYPKTEAKLQAIANLPFYEKLEEYVYCSSMLPHA